METNNTTNLTLVSKGGSSARGIYQIIDGTREGVRQKYYPTISKDDFEKLYDTSADFQRKVAANVIQDSYASAVNLKNKYGLTMEVPGLISLVYYQGPGGADVYLKALRDSGYNYDIAQTVLDNYIRKNNGGKLPKNQPVIEYVSNWLKKYYS